MARIATERNSQLNAFPLGVEGIRPKWDWLGWVRFSLPIITWQLRDVFRVDPRGGQLMRHQLGWASRDGFLVAQENEGARQCGRGKEKRHSEEGLRSGTCRSWVHCRHDHNIMSITLRDVLPNQLDENCDHTSLGPESPKSPLL